jgi:hypothetical protein
MSLHCSRVHIGTGVRSIRLSPQVARFVRHPVTLWLSRRELDALSGYSLPPLSRES